jgi:hypothetical protein
MIAGKSPVRYVLDGAKIGRFRRSGLVWLIPHNKAKSRWWAQQDSNLRHADYESAALPTELWARQWVKHTRYFTLLKIF